MASQSEIEVAKASVLMAVTLLLLIMCFYKLGGSVGRGGVSLGRMSIGDDATQKCFAFTGAMMVVVYIGIQLVSQGAEFEENQGFRNAPDHVQATVGMYFAVGIILVLVCSLGLLNIFSSLVPRSSSFASSQSLGMFNFGRRKKKRKC